MKRAVNIPVIANGDITSSEYAKRVLDVTGADGVMIGCGGQGRRWFYREAVDYLDTDDMLAKLTITRIRDLLVSHLDALDTFCGAYIGVRVARKHVRWYLSERRGSACLRRRTNQSDTPVVQMELVSVVLDAATTGECVAA